MPDLIDAVPGVSQAKLAVIGVVGVGILVACISLGLYIWGLKSSITSLTADNKLLTSNNLILTENVKTVKSNFASCQSTNMVQDATISDLLKERKDSETAIANLAKKDIENAKTIGDMKSRLEKMNGDPSNNGPLAPNLRETIRSIQNSRGKK